jgi:hypothetical protein
MTRGARGTAGSGGSGGDGGGGGYINIWATVLSFQGTPSPQHMQMPPAVP